ncbi:MAG: 30S ribosomal protein S12 methylthiotransferase RimO [Gammaproteobacteria bacterium]|nr:30S ribosomal protein S12 methylthiotransferase RimO [Gammaproteobacteria bacterium]
MVIANPKIGFVSLGCPKALVDSERILTQLRADGYEIVPTYPQADLVVVNTCGFIEAAVEESLDAIGEALNENGKVIVTGCLGARKERILEKYPEILHVSGPHAYEEVVSAIHKHAPPNRDPFVSLLPPQGIKLTPRHYAYLKISEGCNHRCTFCIIPSMRGDLVSRPIGQVLKEAEILVNAGVKELLVISQDTSAYGVDTKYREDVWRDKKFNTHITDLAKGLGELGAWIRLHYVYPYPHVDNIIPLMAEEKILPYLDVPFQHASPRILKAMKRPANSQNNLERIKKWRSICPELSIRSTFIVGFPGETEEEFNELLEFLVEARLNKVGCFKYSPVEGAKANEIAGAIDEEVKTERWQRFMEIQSRISADLLEEKIDSIQTVLIDEIDSEGVIARSKGDAPEIDGKVFLDLNPKLKVGDFIKVRITDADEYDLYAEIASDED